LVHGARPTAPIISSRFHRFIGATLGKRRAGRYKVIIDDPAAWRVPWCRAMAEVPTIAASTINGFNWLLKILWNSKGHSRSLIFDARVAFIVTPVHERAPTAARFLRIVAATSKSTASTPSNAWAYDLPESRRSWSASMNCWRLVRRSGGMKFTGADTSPATDRGMTQELRIRYQFDLPDGSTTCGLNSRPRTSGCRSDADRSAVLPN